MPGPGGIVEFWFDLSAAPSVPPTLTRADVIAAFGADSADHLGSGAFGETWKTVTGTKVEAVKIVMHPGYPLARLQREAQGLRLGACDNVVELLDVGRTVVGGEDRAFFRCEYVHGGDAAYQLRSGHWPDPEEQVAFCHGVLRGLAALHAANSVHRDLKFENVALRGGDWSQPVLLDLGLVRIEDGASLTLYPTLMGTPPFMAPEQVREERARKASDLWALGTMMFVLAERRHPYYGNYTDRIQRAEALRRMEAGPPDTSACPTQIRDLVARWLHPTMHHRGSAQSALRRLDISGGNL